MSDRDVAAPLERLQTIEESVRRALGTERSWLTAEEFLANVEARKRKLDKERLDPEPVNHKTAEGRDYQLKRYVTYNRQMEFKSPEVPA